MHQAAQPITVLQGTLELALLTASTVEEYRHAIERSLEEVQRINDCFKRLRTLAHLHQAVPDGATFAASSMVKAVLMSVKERATSTGVELSRLRPRFADCEDSGPDRVRRSQGRASTALKLALSDLLLHLESGSKVFVQIEEEETADVLIRVHTDGPAQQSPWVADSQPLLVTSRRELARAIAASAGAELTFRVSRRDLLTRLPKVFSTEVHGEAKQQKGAVSLCLV